MALVGIGLANFWSGCVTRNVLFSTGLTPRAGQGGGREWVDPRWDMENNHPKKTKRKIRILGGGSNFSRRSLAVSFAPKAVASGWRKTASIPCKYAMKISINILSSRIRSRGVGPSNMAAHVP